MLGFQPVAVAPISAIPSETGIVIPIADRLHHLTVRGLEYPKALSADGSATLGRTLNIAGGMEPKTILGRQGPRSL